VRREIEQEEVVKSLILIQGKTHFGWARVRMGGRSKSFVATITRYAYEAVPNRPILTGKTKGRIRLWPTIPFFWRLVHPNCDAWPAGSGLAQSIHLAA
jgi:hypothetical protein